MNINLSKEENIFALRFYSELLKSIDINSEAIVSDDIVLEEIKDFMDVEKTKDFKQGLTINKYDQHEDANKLKIKMKEEKNKKSDTSKLKLKKVYFIENPLFKLISINKINEFFETVDRSSWIVKVSSVFSLYKEVSHEIKFNMNLKERSWWLYYTLNIDYSKMQAFSYFLILAINILLMFSLKTSNYSEFDTYYYVVVGLGSLLITLNAIYFAIFMTSRYKFLIDYELKKAKAEKSLTNIKRIKIYFNKIFFNRDGLFLISNVILGIVGVSHPTLTFTFTILLLHFVSFSKTSLILLAAFKSGSIQMIYMLLFLIILVWMYSLIAFYFINRVYLFEVGGGIEENICNSVSQCFISFFNYGVRNGGGLADAIPKKEFSDTAGYVGRWLIDVFFFIVIILLFLNMINGIIINTFSQLREEQEIKNDDIQNNCFICNLDRTTLQKKKIYFDVHISKHHSITNYLMYLINIKLKPEKDLDPDETRVKNSLLINDVSFFPCEKTLNWDWTLIEKDSAEEN